MLSLRRLPKLHRNIQICRAMKKSENLTPTTANMSAIEKKKESDMLETIDIEDLPRPQKRFAKQFEKVNEERVKEMFAKNYKNHIAFTVLVGLVVGIYWYTLYSVKQETFLEEIDEEMAMTNPKTHGHLAAPKK
ncbi:unnamed protein product [Caenorhabditis angaria]|uniref:Cytochrome c oxidase assembly factor 3 n=1 Tax=Caenorhabditis angaria TaxID=860376 RepID=A0A9P1IDL0_9PELO|nr:unnamed protein product [Caenorhabditis angaria]